MAVIELNHPIIHNALTQMRDKQTSSSEFRQRLNEIAGLMTFEITRDMPLIDKEILTPLMKMRSPILPSNALTLVPILRAGLGMVDGILSLFPDARVGHIGVYRNENTLQAEYYYCKLPDKIEERKVILVDPMLATGGSAIFCIDYLKKKNINNLSFLCLIATPEGIKAVQDKYPAIDIFVAKIDAGLDKNGYILPGLGDAGDRIFGTK